MRTSVATNVAERGVHFLPSRRAKKKWHEMERETAVRLLRALVAAGLRQRESMANAAIRGVAGQAGLDEFDTAHQYAREQGWLVEADKAFSTTLTPAGWRAARGE
jgi:hypothetical protein